MSCIGETLQSWASMPALQLQLAQSQVTELHLFVQDFPLQYLPHISLHEETEDIFLWKRVNYFSKTCELHPQTTVDIKKALCL